MPKNKKSPQAEPQQTAAQEAGLPENFHSIDVPPIIPGQSAPGGAPPIPATMQPFFSGSMPPFSQLEPDFVNTKYGGGSTPSVRLMPVGASGNPQIVAAVQSVVKNIVSQNASGALSMPNIFTVGGAFPVTNPSGGTIDVALVPENAATFFAGPISPSGIPQLDGSANAIGSGTTVAVGPLTDTLTNEWAVMLVSSYDTASASGWVTQYTDGSAVTIFSKFVPSGVVSGIATLASPQNWAAVMALFYTKGTTPTVVQSQAAGGSSPQLLTLSSPVTAGNGVLAISAGRQVSGFPPDPLTSITDSQGNIYFPVDQAHQTGIPPTNAYLYYCPSAKAGSTTLTFTYGGAHANSLCWAAEVTPFLELSGIPTFRPIVASDLPFGAVSAVSNNPNSIVVGSISGRTLDLAWSGFPLPLNEGGTGVDLSATGGANQFVKQNTLGGPFTVGTIGSADLPADVAYLDVVQTFTVQQTFPTIAINGEVLYSGSVALANQSTSIGSTPLVVTPIPSALYQITYTIETTTAGTGGTVTLSITWNNGASQTFTTSTVSLSTLGSYQSGVLVVKSATGSIAYSTTVSAATGSPAYSLDLRVTPLG